MFKTPAGADFVLPTLALAEAIAEQCHTHTIQVGGKEKPNPALMPMMQLASTAFDIVGKKRDEVIRQLIGFVGSELLCHRAEAPAALVKQQHDVWQPMLDWCEKHFGAKLNSGTGIMPIPQSDEASENLRRAISAYDDFCLTGLRQAADISGSLVLALALAEKHLSAAQVFEAAELDASFQMLTWGEDPASLARRKALLADLQHCENWFLLLSRRQ
jgi:chaperone required for assembly of F1-ATPase